MSWRTAIEINHDYLQDIGDDADEFVATLIRALSSADYKAIDKLTPAVTYLGTRHHADSATYEVK